MNETAISAGLHEQTEAKAGFMRQDALLINIHVGLAYFFLALGGIAGLFQVLDRAGIYILPAVINYYELLTLHGILLALVFTTLFIVALLFAGTAKTTGGELTAAARGWGWAGLVTMAIGTLTVVEEVLAGGGTVLYTFYAPMGASPAFYIGLALLIVGSWLSSIGIFVQYTHWRSANPGQRSPLFAYMSVATMIMWIVATVPVVAEVLLQLIPWSLGWSETINVLLSRTLFWAFGHPLVYFWLLPAYIVWYISLPKLIGSHVFSDSLARFAFLLLIIFSLPVGFHHELMEPGIAAGWKYLQVGLTMAVVYPSFMTAFAVVGTMEQAGRKKGGRGLLGWITKLPWKDARFLSIFVAIMGFIPVGATGIINASFQLNQVVHNSMFVVGHFHLALATTVVLTFFGSSYWLIPALTNRVFTPTMNRLGILQAVCWGVGMFIMSSAMYISGLLGNPRRTSYTTYMAHPQVEAWAPYHVAMAFGGTLLITGIILILIIVANLFFFAPRGETEFPVAETVEDPQKTPAILERWSIWIPVMIVLVLIAYAIPTLHTIQEAPPGMPPIQTW